MRARNNYADKRQISYCAYCRGETGTRDHVPSKVFLDKPYPENLPLVFACYDCNQSFSLDEEYVACLIECAKSNSLEIDKLERDYIKTIFQRKPALLKRIQDASECINDILSIKIEEERLSNVLSKLVKGHLLFEFNFPINDEQIEITYFPLNILKEEERTLFDEKTAIELTKMPEVGCRACENLYIINEQIICLTWNIVQSGLYRYIVGYNNSSYIVRIVIGEYFACEAFIDD